MYKKIEIPEWLWQRIAREHKAPRVWGGNIEAVFAETEKAYKVMMGSVDYTVFVWIPKSQCTWVETDNQFAQTVICNSYEEAIEHRDFLRSCFC